MQHYRLTRPDLDFHVDVTLHERDGRYTATADLAEGTLDIGTGDTPRQAGRVELMALEEPYASEMAAGANSERSPG
jgi:hypothetical protein